MIWLLTLGVMLVFAGIIAIGLLEDAPLYIAGLLVIVTVTAFSYKVAEALGTYWGLLP